MSRPWLITLSGSYLVATPATNPAKCSTLVLTDSSQRTPSGKPFAFKTKAQHRGYCRPLHASRRVEGVLTSKMLWSVIIDILIALVVILFWSVLFPLSSPRSSYLLDKTQEALHLSRHSPAQGAPARSNSAAAPGAGGAWKTNAKAGDQDALLSHLPLCHHQCRDVSHRRGESPPGYGFTLRRFLI